MIEGLFDAALRRSPAQPLFLWRAARRLVVLAYHTVADPDRFAQQITHLAAAMQPVSLDEVIEAQAGGQALPRRAVLVTFDDGDRSVYEQALPVLREHGVPAAVFVIAGLLDSRKPFWWIEAEGLLRRGGRAAILGEVGPVAAVAALKRLPDEQRLAALEELRRSAGGTPPEMPQLRRSELRRLESAGVRVGNHTLTHPCLDRCTREKVGFELSRAHDILTEALGSPPAAFAYPNGNWDARAAAHLRDLGYAAAFLFDHRIGRYPPADALSISRVRVNSTTPLDRFRIIVSGLHPFLHHAIGRS